MEKDFLLMGKIFLPDVKLLSKLWNLLSKVWNLNSKAWKIFSKLWKIDCLCQKIFFSLGINIFFLRMEFFLFAIRSNICVGSFK
jgi:hypothetical protein